MPNTLIKPGHFVKGQILCIGHDGANGFKHIEVEVREVYENDAGVWQHVLHRTDNGLCFARASTAEIQACQCGWGD